MNLLSGAWTARAGTYLAILAASVTTTLQCIKGRCNDCDPYLIVGADGRTFLTAHLKTDGRWVDFETFNQTGQEIEGDSDGFTLSWSHFGNGTGDTAMRNIQVRNGMGSHVLIEGLALRMREPWCPPPACGWLSNGYQSWSMSSISGADVPASAGNHENPAGHNTDLVAATPNTSWWLAWSSQHSNKNLLQAATARSWKSRFILEKAEDQTRVTIVQGVTGDGKQAGSDQTVLFEDIEFQSDFSNVPVYRNGIPSPWLPVGWNSWNTLFDAVTEADILANARFIKENLPEIGINNIQVDDGWEVDWGGWEANEKFPSGMDGVARKIRDLGFIPGIWFAPFLVDETSPVAIEHPDWFLTAFEGTRITYPVANMGGGSTKLLLDTTHPEARDWMLGQIRKLVGWGYRYLKLDFLFAAAVEGRRFDANKTSVEAYRDAMTAIGEAAGPDVYILASGAPILPTIGLAHGIRTGPDIAFFTLPYEWRYIKAEVLNLATRHFLYPAIAPDPDTALVRGIPENEARYYLTATLMAPDIFAIGDDLPALSASKVDLYRRAGTFLRLFFDQTIETPTELSIPSLFEYPARVLPKTNLDVQLFPNSYPVPPVWVRRAGEARAVALLNDEDANTVIRAEISGTYQAEELWSGIRKTISGVIEEEIGPRDARLYLFTSQ